MKCLHKVLISSSDKPVVKQIGTANSGDKQQEKATALQMPKINYSLFQYYPKRSKGKVPLLNVRLYICCLLRTYGATVTGTAV